MKLFDVYKIFDESKTIKQFCDNVDQFVDEALLEKKRKALVSEFYYYFLQFAASGHVFAEGNCSYEIENEIVKKYVGDTEKLHSLGIFDTGNHMRSFYKDGEKGKKYYVCNGKEAFWIVLYYHLPPYTSPVKTLKALKEYTRELRESYSEKGGDLIDVESALEILNYVDQKYNFFNIVHNEYRPIFAIADVTHNERNSVCHVFRGYDGLIRTSVCLTRNGNTTDCSPEAILFHEIGHTLHTRLFYLFPKAKEMTISALEKTCFPNIANLDEEDQMEIIADAISMGMMYGTPYEKYDPFDPFDPTAAKSKRMLSEIVQKMIDLMAKVQETIQKKREALSAEADCKKGA